MGLSVFLRDTSEPPPHGGSVENPEAGGRGPESFLASSEVLVLEKIPGGMRNRMQFWRVSERVRSWLFG